MARVLTRSGTEGPRHDPYHYDEVSFIKTDGTVIECKISGLGYGHVSIDDQRFFKGTDYEAETFFEQEAGMSWSDALAIPYKLEDRRLRRMTPRQRDAAILCMEADHRLMGYAV